MALPFFVDVHCTPVENKSSAPTLIQKDNISRKNFNADTFLAFCAGALVLQGYEGIGV